MKYSRIILASMLITLIFTNFTLAIPPGENSSNGSISKDPDAITGLSVSYTPTMEDILAGNAPNYTSSFDIGNVLGDRDNDYTEIYEPWASKGAIHAIAYDESTGLLAFAGGYLYDNEIHIYRLNSETGEFDKVWDSGSGIIQSDIMALAFGDTDLNEFIEIVAGSSDGRVYVFEQRHIYDPYTNTENMFDLVWTSPSMFRVFDLTIEDVDDDFRPDIIAGTWNGIFFLSTILTPGILTRPTTGSAIIRSGLRAIYPAN